MHLLLKLKFISHRQGRRGLDRMVIGFTTTCVFSAHHTKEMTKNPAHGKAYSIQQYVIKMVSDLPQVGVFIPVLPVFSTNNHRSVLLSRYFRFPPPII